MLDFRLGICYTTNMIEVIKAGLKLRKRVAGQTIYFRGFLSTPVQLQIQEEIATLQIGLDRPGTREGQVLGKVDDAGVEILRIWQHNQFQWTLYPYGGDVGSKFAFELLLGVNGGSEAVSDVPNILPVWSEDEGVMFEYHFYNMPNSIPFLRVGNVFQRWHNFTFPNTFIAGMVAGDFRVMLPRATISFDSFVGSVNVTYATKFHYPTENFGPWTGAVADHGNLFAFGLIEGRYVNGVKPDVFR